MMKLESIKDYVKQTAKIISSVIDMDVLICNKDLLLIADTSKQNNCENKCLNTDSILTRVMEENKTIILESRELHYGCLKCNQYKYCDVEAIVGVPIVASCGAIGSIGVYADSIEKKVELLDKKDYYLKFISRMSDLMVGRLIELEKNIEINIIRKRLNTIMNSIDTSIVAADKDGRILYSNCNFENLVKHKIDGNLNIYDFINESVANEIIKNEVSVKNKEIYVKSTEEKIFSLLSGKPILYDGKNKETLFILKRMSDVYEEVNDLSIPALPTSFDDILGESKPIQDLKKRARKISNSKSTVFIQGESGTGKELFARAIHNYSNNNDKPFIAINCAAIPDNLLESELFGYEEGAFTGAKKGGKLGKFQLAEGGTIFLDEIGEMPLHLQTKLLRVLQERCIEKLGGTESIPIDVRVIAATNKNLQQLIKEGKYREDLYYRLNVIPIKMTPLRDRKEDIPTLLTHFLDIYNSRLSKNLKGFTLEAEKALMNYNWKGNVRELQNVVEYIVNMESGEYIVLESIPIGIRESLETSNTENKQIPKLDDVTRKLINEALELYGNTVEGKTLAAKALGISRATLYRKIKEYKL